MFTNANVNSLLCIMGPTASGKSQLALQLAELFPAEIISVDSALVYRGMDIGTAKPSLAERARIKHHLIDICDPIDPYSAGQFRQDVLKAIAQIQQRGKIPILVGGTMLYFRALQRGLADLPTANASLRAELTAEAQQHGWEFMHAKLQHIDPVSAARIHPNDPQRIQRALEIYLLTGKSLTQHAELQAQNQLPLHWINLAIAPQDREYLHKLIAQRFQMMLELGFITEVEKLFQRGDLSPDLPSIRAVGYRQVWDYLAGNSDFAAMQTQAIAATRQLAKRQLTWLRSWENLNWFDSMSADLLDQVIKFLSKNKFF